MNDEQQQSITTENSSGRSKEMIPQGVNTLISDVSRVLLHYKDPSYTGSLNEKHRELSASVPGYNIMDHFYLNQDLLQYYASLKAKGVRLVIYTSETIQDDPNLAPLLASVFDEVYSAQKLGINKKEAEGYKKLLETLSRKPGQAVFVDDTPANVGAAADAHLETVHFLSNDKALPEATQTAIAQLEMHFQS